MHKKSLAKESCTCSKPHLKGGISVKRVPGFVPELFLRLPKNSEISQCKYLKNTNYRVVKAKKATHE